MQKHGSIKGILQTSNGRPVADAIVMVKDGDHEFNDIASVSNEQGEFYVSGIVIPGRYTLQIQHGNASVNKEIHVNSPDAVLMIHL